MDLFTRRIVGWSIEPHMTREMVLAALERAYVNRRDNDEDAAYDRHENKKAMG